ncbi:hypothetical protein S40293_10269 [Stachybotrys chartarum IBT 40293]|nr:hypothetical protein S40293_10269 [Stachybotrys chartarum IBT 40293]
MDHEGYRGGIWVTLPIAMTIAGFFAVSIYNVIEINVKIFFTFRKYTGLYFWSLIFASWGIAIHSLGFLLLFFQLCKNNYVNIVIITLGGVPMVIGQSVVLYSRLHLIVQDRQKIRWVRNMIILSFFLFTIPPTVLNFGSNSSHSENFLRPFHIYEKIALSGFSAQEIIISSLYMWEARKMLRLMTLYRSGRASRVMWHLIYINILVILMDMTVLGTELGGAHEIQTTYKSAVYSVKLKLEFPVLDQLRSLVAGNRHTDDSLSLPTSPPISPLTSDATPSSRHVLASRGNSVTNNPFPLTYQPRSSLGCRLRKSLSRWDAAWAMDLGAEEETGPGD